MKEESLWLDEPGSSELDFPPADGRIEADVAIIGAGITGLSAACHLKARFPDLAVVVLERDRSSGGLDPLQGFICQAPVVTSQDLTGEVDLPVILRYQQ